HVLERDFGVALDRRLTSEHGAAFSRALVVNRAAHHRHAAGVALSRAAIVRNDDPAAEPGVDQGFADLGFDGMTVDDEIAAGHRRSLLLLDGDADWTRMAGVARLRVVEHRDPHVEIAPG